MKVREVVEGVGFDWCDFIVMQITAIKNNTHEIRKVQRLITYLFYFIQYITLKYNDTVSKI
jgi:hypothetical protein